MSSVKPSPLSIPPELEAEMTPAVRVFVELLLDRIGKLGAGAKDPAELLAAAQYGASPRQSRLDEAEVEEETRRAAGHKKHERPLMPTEECDDVKLLKPTECRRCGEKLSGSDPEPLRHQVWELPEIKPHVTEYQRHRLACPACGETTCAELPCGVPQGQSGPRLMAFTALLMAYYRQSKRRTAEFLRTLLGPTLLSGADREDRKPGDGGHPAIVRGVGGSTARRGAVEHRRNGDQAGKRQGLAVDVRRPSVHRVCGACHARGDGVDRVPWRVVPRHRHLRSGQNVLASGRICSGVGPI